MTQTQGWNWAGVLAFICGAAVVIPSLLALAVSLAAVARSVF